MAGHVLVAYDGSPQSDTALEYAVEEFGDADRITVLNVIDPVAAGYSADVSFPSGAEQWYENAKADAQRVVEEAIEGVANRDVPVEADLAVGRPAGTVVKYVRDNEVDHVVMGSHGRTGVSRILLGSVAEEVMRRSPVPVTVVR